MTDKAREQLFAVSLPLVSALVFCAVWQQATQVIHISATLLPPPSLIGFQVGHDWSNLLSNAAVTGLQALWAFLLAALLGIVAGVVMTVSPFLRDMLYPLVVLLQLVPKVALAPLFVMWTGTGTLSHLVFGVFLSFFPVMIATLSGLEQTSRSALNLCRSLVASPAQTFLMVRLPYALPYIFNGLRVASTLAVTGIVIAEFITAQSGLGYVIQDAASRIDSPEMFAAIFLLCLVGLLLFGLTVLVERGLARRFQA